MINTTGEVSLAQLLPLDLDKVQSHLNTLEHLDSSNFAISWAILSRDTGYISTHCSGGWIFGKPYPLQQFRSSSPLKKVTIANANHQSWL